MTDGTEHAMTPLIELAGSAGRWALARWSAVRGTGFPISMVLALGATKASRTVDELLDAEADLVRTRDALYVALREAEPRMTRETSD